MGKGTRNNLIVHVCRPQSMRHNISPQITNYGDLAKCIRKATKATKATKAKHEEKENA